MEKYVPMEKMSKKTRREYHKVRRATWGALNPVTRRPPNPKVYNRNNARRKESLDDGHC